MKKAIVLLAILSVYSILSSEILNGKTEGREEFIFEPVFNSKIYFYESGKQHDKSIVLIHGIGEEGSAIWKNLIPELENKFHVIAFDLPGFARSGKENQLYSPENYAALVNWIVKKYANGPIYVTGHSMGGAIALYYAATYPKNLERLIIADAAGILHRAAFAKKIGSIKPGNNKFLSALETPITILNNSILATIENFDSKMPENINKTLESREIRKKLYGGDPSKIAGIALFMTDFSGLIDKINIPTLIIWGESDTIAPLRTGRMLMWNINGSELKIMPGLGHTPMSEKPDEFNKVILNWLALPDAKKPEQKKPLPAREMVYVCEDRNAIIADAEYDRIEIKNCSNVRIVGVVAKNIIIDRSIVHIENSFIKSGDFGVKVTDSVIEISGCTIDSGAGVITSNSSVDLSGVKLTGKTAALREAGLKSRDRSTIIFSVSKISSPFNNGYKHEIKLISDKEPY